jgi:hypothetical protein
MLLDSYSINGDIVVLSYLSAQNDSFDCCPYIRTDQETSVRSAACGNPEWFPEPGERIVEGKWAAKFGVAQASIREAINILAQEGFVAKASGRSARVIHLSETDVAHIYQLRGAIEGLAARLAALSRQDLNVLQMTVNTMRESARTGDREGLIDCDLH